MVGLRQESDLGAFLSCPIGARKNMAGGRRDSHETACLNREGLGIMETAIVLPVVSCRWVSFMGIWFHRGKLGTEMSQWPNDKCSLQARNFARASKGVCVLPQSEVKGGSHVSLWSSVPLSGS